MINGGQTPSEASGVTSLNLLTGALSLIAGTNITITPSGDTIIIDATDSGPGITSINGNTLAAQLITGDNGVAIDFSTPGTNVIKLQDDIIAGYLTGLSSSVQMQIDALVAGTSFRGGYDASSNLFPSTGGSGIAGAIQLGDQWSITVEGTLGGVDVRVGADIIALADLPGQTSGNWNINQSGITSVFARPGPDIIAQTGDYTVSQVTGAASTTYVDAGLATKEPLIIILPIAKGGTGQATANAALNALLPSQTGNANKILKTDATNSSWVDISSLAEEYNAGGNTPNSIVARDGFGELHANIADESTAADTIGIVPDTVATLTYPLFVNNLGPSFEGARTNTGFNYNAVTNTLTVNVAGYATTADLTAGLATKEPLITVLPITEGGTGQITATAAFKALAPPQSTKTGQFLTTNGTNTNWQLLTGTNGILSDYLGVGQTTIGNYQLAVTYNISTTLVDENFVFMSTTAQTITLPDISFVAGLNNGNLYAVTIINLNIATTTIAPQGADLLNGGASTYSLNGAYNSITFIADSVTGSWYIRSTGISTSYLASLLATKEPLITVLPATKGGTGLNSYAIGDLIVGSSSNTFTKLGSSSNDFVLKSTGIGAPLVWGGAPIHFDVYDSFNNTGLTTTTDILVAIATNSSTAAGIFILTISDGSANELDIIYQLTINPYNFGNQPKYLIMSVNDSAGIITRDNLSNYLTFFIHTKTGAGNYIAASVRMTGGLLYGASTLRYTCGGYSVSFLTTNTAISQYLCRPLSNLVTPDNSLLISGNVVQLGTFPASSVYAYAINTGGSSISMYSFNSSSGLLVPLSPATIATGTAPADIISTPNAKYIYTTNTTANTIGLYVSALVTGQLATPVTTALTAPGFMAMHPTGKFLYVRSGTSIFVYNVTSATGVLVAASNNAAGTVPFHMAISPNGLYLYVTDTGAATVRQYSINTTTGALALLSTPTIASAGAYGITIHPLGTFAYVTNNTGGTVRQYAIASNGQLSVLSPAQQSVGNGPRFMAIHPMGIYAYVINTTDNTISCLSLSTSTGQLAPLTVPTVATGTTPSGIRISASGQYLYVTNSGTTTISAYHIDTSTGALTPIVGSPITAGSGPNQIIIV